MTTSQGLKDILVHIDRGPRNRVRLAVAANLARKFGAHLTGLCVMDIPRAEYLYGAPMPFATFGPEQLVARLREDAATAAMPLKQQFLDVLASEGLEGEWRQVEGESPEIVALHARYADLTVVAQPSDDEPRQERSRDATLVTTLMSSGRPVLAVPYAGDFPVVGDRVLIAWNTSREATRAVNDALPLLRLASLVTVLAINPQSGIGGHGDVPAADIALHLARHGVKAEAAHTVSEDISAANTLLSYAADIGADLIVCGGYGHSRARELVFGGVTRQLLGEMTVPVLLSH